MATAESGLWKWLSGARKIVGEMLDMNRVENSLMSGMPDVEGSLSWKQFWIELKTAKRPARDTTVIRFKVRDREAQIAWLELRWGLAGNAWLLCQVGSGHLAKRYLIPGKHAQAVYDGVTEETLARMSMVDPKATKDDIIRRAAQRGAKNG